MEKLTVVKVGGAIVEDPASLSMLLDNFAALPGHKVLVHGGGRRATKVAASLGIETKMVEGRRVTDANMLEVVTMVYGGLVNKNIVAQLQARQVNAIGLTGADLGVMLSHKRPVRNGVDFGFVGDVDHVGQEWLHTLINANAVPVMAPLTHDGHGTLLNTNADTIAAETAKAMTAHYEVTLVYCFEKPGVLSQADNDNSVIGRITHDSFQELTAKGIIGGGMLPKIQNALNAVDEGVARVVITKATDLKGDHGTLII